MKNYKALEAHVFYQSGHVHEIKHLKTDSGCFLMKCDVSPSFRQAADAHKPWLCVDKTGTVQCGHCNCMAGYVSLVI